MFIPLTGLNGIDIYVNINRIDYIQQELHEKFGEIAIIHMSESVIKVRHHISDVLNKINRHR